MNSSSNSHSLLKSFRRNAHLVSGWDHLNFYLFLSGLGLCCCMSSSLVAVSRSFSLAAVDRLFIAVVPLVAELGLQVHGLQELWPVGSRAWAQQLWCLRLVAPQHVGSSWIRDRTRVSCTASVFFTTEPPGKPLVVLILILNMHGSFINFKSKHFSQCNSN